MKNKNLAGKGKDAPTDAENPNNHLWSGETHRTGLCQTQRKNTDVREEHHIF